MTLRRLIQMRDDGLLRQNQFIHFLGISTLNVSIALSFIQRELRKYPQTQNIQITFDSSTPVDFAINGEAVTGYEFKDDNWGIHCDKVNQREHQNSNTLLHDLGRFWVGKSRRRKPAQSTLSHYLTLDNLVGEWNHTKGKRIQSSLQQALLINHNTQAMIEGFKQANRLLDDKYRLDRPWPIRHLHEYIRVIFEAENPMQIIDELAVELDRLALGGKFGR